MSATTIEDAISAKILERLKAEGSPNTTFLISGAVVDSRTNRENAIADEVAKDPAVGTRKTTTDPVAFTASDRAICVSYGVQELKDRGIINKLRFNALVRYIVLYGDNAFKDAIPNFQELSID